MASEANLALLREAKLLDDVTNAGPNDLLITLQGESEAAIAGALGEAQAAFDQKAATTTGGAKRAAPRSLEMGLELEPNSNVALISTPGDYAASEALKALHLGLNVMIFSDNVSVEDEVAIKRYARSHGLWSWGRTAAPPSSTGFRSVSPMWSDAAPSASWPPRAPVCSKSLAWSTG